MMHIVHIEEDRPLSDMLRMAFQTIEPNLILRQFTSADCALPYVQQHRQAIDLFILDIRLSGSMDGLAFAQMLREESYPGHIVLTSSHMSLNHTILNAPNVEFMPKPWHIIDLTPKLLQYRITKNMLPPLSAQSAI
jgi:DNA-binding response OmpR family regulator